MMTLKNIFSPINASVDFIQPDLIDDISGDIVVATAWSTVSTVMSISNVKDRFYLVQDYEPSFYPMGSNWVAAEETYKKNINCICAGPWLENTMKEKYGRWATHFPSLRKSRCLLPT